MSTRWWGDQIWWRKEEASKKLETKLNADISLILFSHLWSPERYFLTSYTIVRRVGSRIQSWEYILANIAKQQLAWRSRKATQEKGEHSCNPHQAYFQLCIHAFTCLRLLFERETWDRSWLHRSSYLGPSINYILTEEGRSFKNLLYFADERYIN